MMYAGKSSPQMCVLRFEMFPWVNLYSVCLHSLAPWKKKNKIKNSVSWTYLLKINLLRGWRPWPLPCSHWKKPIYPIYSRAVNECREVPTENKNLESFLYMWCHCGPVPSRQNLRDLGNKTWWQFHCAGFCFVSLQSHVQSKWSA